MPDQPAKIGPYRILKQIGKGGMGEVYLAHDERLDRRVALKRIRPDVGSSPERHRRFQQEARLAARLNHPSIVQIYDVLSHEGQDCIVMEYVEGTTLREMLSEAAPLPVQQALSLALQIAHGLTEAHRRGVVHRDLKPENILVSESGRAKMTDFGIAKRLAEEIGQGQTALTQTGSLVGTCRAMSPEQVQGDPVGPRSDLFSFGGLLYEALTGSSPFSARTELLTLNQILHHRPAPAKQLRAEIPAEVSDLIDHLLEKDPLHRPRSTAEVVSILERAGARSSSEDQYSTKAPTSHRRPPKPPSTASSSRSAAASGHPHSGTSTSAERRPLTVLCCELFQQSHEEADPEEMLESVQAFQAVCGRIVERFEGFAAQHLSTGLVVYFGYPRASEHAAQRAALAGLDILAAMEQLNRDLMQPPQRRLSAHLGIHYAPAVVSAGGNGLEKTQLVLGEGPQTAARLARLAGADSLLASAQAQRLLAGLFHSEEVTLHTDSGQEVPAFRIVGPSGATDRIQAAMRTGLTPLVGRERELNHLRDLWKQACQGRGQVVLMGGESGLGKSRLAQAFGETVAGNSADYAEWRCSPYHRNSAFHPVISYLERSLHLDSEDTTDHKRGRLKQALEQLNLPLDQAMPLLADLLSVGEAEQLEMGPQRRKQKTLETLLAWLFARAERQPLYCLVEDVHWMDPSSLELLTALIDQVPTSRMLLLCSFRPTFQPAWGTRSHITQINLDRLDDEQAGDMVRKVAGDKSLAKELVGQLVQKADGVPLFVEELTKAVLESEILVEREGGYQTHGGDLRKLDVPTTLQDSLLARLDRLGGPAKQAAQIGAVIGREFTQDLHLAVSGLRAEELEAHLSLLVKAELLYRQGFLSQTRYIFKHALIRDAAYQSLLKRQRRECHSQIAQALARQFPRTATSQPELLAHHWAEAGRFEQAVDWSRRAGQRALERSANAEAYDHMLRGLELLAHLPPGPERDEQELALQTALGTTVSITRGYGVPEAAEAFERALEICRSQEDSPQLFWAMWGLRRYYSMRGEFQTALQLGHRLLRLSKKVRQPDPSLAVAAHFGLGAAFFMLGRFEESHQQLEEAIACDSPDRTIHSALPTGEDSGVFSLSFASAVLWFRGYPRKASQKIEQALQTADRISHSFSRNSALQFRTLFGQLCRDPASVEADGQTVMENARNQGSFAYLVQSRIFLGWAMSSKPGQSQQKIAEGIQLIQEGLDQLSAAGSVTWRTYFLSLMVDACMHAERHQEAAKHLDEAFELARRTGERFYLAELHRLRGELALAGEIDAAAPEFAERCREAEVHFQKALETARSQGARVLELRAAVSQSRLWLSSEETGKARKLIEETYKWFEEGFESSDLSQARELLDALSAQAPEQPGG